MNSLFQDRFKQKMICKKETKISYGILLFFYDKMHIRGWKKEKPIDIQVFFFNSSHPNTAFSLAN